MWVENFCMLSKPMKALLDVLTTSVERPSSWVEHPTDAVVPHHISTRNNPSMYYSNISPRITGLAAALFLAMGVTRAIAPPSAPPAAESVELTAWLHVEGLTMEDVVVTVLVNGETRTAGASENGRVDLVLPADAEALVRFEKPGHLPKEVVVDTRYAQDGDHGKRTRHVKFAVIMQLERHMAGLTYPGPGGTLSLDAGGGCLAVAHDRNVVPARRNVPMVF